jgi:hypothetical protein
LPLLEQMQLHFGKAVDIRYRQRDAGSIVIDFVKQ